jgi:hypothetical protein
MGQGRKMCAQQASLLFLCLSVSAGCGEIRYRDVIAPTKPIHRIEINGDSGVVEIVPADSPRVEFAVRAPDGVATVSHEERDGVLTVNARCRTPILCGVDTEIHVPDGVAISIALNKGEVWATGVADLNISLGEGSIDVETIGRTTVQLGQGNVRVVSVHPEQLRVAVGKGNIDVQVSPEVWNISIVSAQEQIVGVTHDDAALNMMELVAPAGHVSVRNLDTMVVAATP